MFLENSFNSVYLDFGHLGFYTLLRSTGQTISLRVIMYGKYL